MSDFADYPEFYTASDEAAREFQSRFFFWTRMHLGLLVAVAVVGGIGATADLDTKVVVVGTVVLMAAAIGVNFALRSSKLDDRWFQCRAFAENTKRETWRYIMKVAHEDARSFRAAIDGIKMRFPEVARAMVKHLNDGALVTAGMEKVRSAPLEERFAIYRATRIGNQRGWYLGQAKAAAKRETLYFWVTLVIELVAVALAAVAVWSGWVFNPAGAVTAIAAGLVAWSHARRYSDLTQTYGVAHQDLQMIAEDVDVVGSEERLAELVEAVEQAVSREHRMWLARRGVAPTAA